MHLPFFRRMRHEEVEKLYAELSSALLGYARALGLDHVQAEDVVQRTFLALMESGGEPDEPRPYLFRAVRNAVFNQLRDRARETEFDDQEPWFEGPTIDAGDEIDLRRSLLALPEEQREVVILHVWGGLSFEETAAALGIPANTAASRYRYALAALRKLLMVQQEGS